MPAIEVLEGVFEELAAQHPELWRKRVRIIVLPEAIEPIGDMQTLSERLKPWIGCIDAPDNPAADQVNEVFLQTLSEKSTVMPTSEAILCDAGPLIALLNRCDPYHRSCVALIQQTRAQQLWTPLACFIEASCPLQKRIGSFALEQLWSM